MATAEVNPIPAGGHPNLYFNSSEIDVMRQAILVDKTPAYAVDVYNAIREVPPEGKPSNLNSLPWPDNYTAGRLATHGNMKACFSYMLEPTQAKGEALAAALLSWTSDPNRGWSHDVQGAGHAHYALAWIYDLLYDQGVFSVEEKASIDDFFVDISRRVAFDNEAWTSSTRHSVEEEGTYRESYENWWQLDFHAGLVFALVSHDQAAVDRLFITTVPEDYFVQDITPFAPDTRDLKNMINGLVYPSGRNFDGYHRGYSFEGEHYHYFALLPAVLGAEAAAHSGFDAWSYKDEALLRMYRTGADWAGAARRGEHLNNWLPFFWAAYRHYPDDEVIRSAVEDASAMSGLPWIFDTTLPLWGVLGDLSVPTSPNEDSHPVEEEHFSPDSGIADEVLDGGRTTSIHDAAEHEDTDVDASPAEDVAVSAADSPAQDPMTGTGDTQQSSTETGADQEVVTALTEAQELGTGGNSADNGGGRSRDGLPSPQAGGGDSCTFTPSESASTTRLYLLLLGTILLFFRRRVNRDKL